MYKLLQKLNYYTDPLNWDRRLGDHYALKASRIWASLNEQITIKALKQIRLKRLKQLIAHAYYMVPFYRDLYLEAGIYPERIKTENDLLDLPLATKSRLKMYSDNERNVARDISYDRMIYGVTSGSTGQPLCYFKDRNYNFERQALKQRFWNWAGVAISEPKICCAPESARNYYPNMTFLNPHHIRSKIKDYIKIIRGTGAQIIFGSPLMAFDLFWEIKQSGLGRFNFKRAILGGHYTTPGIRKFFKQEFGCEVFEFYACGELGLIAYECEIHQGMHIQEENTILEIVDKNGLPLTAGNIGDILLTTLSNDVMPFIRYYIGDRGAFLPGACRCGRTSRRIIIEGRMQEFFLMAANGESLPPAVFRDLLDCYFEYFQRYQIVQNSIDKLTLKIVPTKLFSNKLISEIAKKICASISCPMHINIELVGDIPPLSSGKFQYFISELWKEKFPHYFLESDSIEKRIACIET